MRQEKRINQPIRQIIANRMPSWEMRILFGLLILMGLRLAAIAYYCINH